MQLAPRERVPFALPSGRAASQIAPRVHRGVVDPHLVMNMRSRCPPADANIANHIPGGDRRALPRAEGRKVRVPRAQSTAMVNDDLPAVAFAPAGEYDHAVGRGTHRGAQAGRDVHAGMKSSFATERIQPLAKPTGDPAEQ